MRARLTVRDLRLRLFEVQEQDQKLTAAGAEFARMLLQELGVQDVGPVDAGAETEAETAHYGEPYPHQGGCTVCRDEHRCNACGSKMQPGESCTNGRCRSCHRARTAPPAVAPSQATATDG